MARPAAGLRRRVTNESYGIAQARARDAGGRMEIELETLQSEALRTSSWITHGALREGN
jgi:hypothetical protein